MVIVRTVASAKGNEMFGLSFKEKTAEALQRGTKAALTGAFFHPTQAKKFGLNEEATFWLFTEALAHQIYMLGMLYRYSTPQEKYKWATSEFSIKNINSALLEHEVKEGLTPSTISSFVFRRCREMDNLAPDERTVGKHYLQSANLIREKDANADVNNIATTLESVAMQYYEQARGMFGV